AGSQYPDYRLLAWVDQYSPWWQELQAYGLPAQADGYAEYLLLLHFDSLFALFVEIDCGSESGTVIKSKIDAFADYALSGPFQSRFVVRDFRVLFITSSRRRMGHIIDLCERASAPGIFWATTVDDFMGSKLFDRYWRRPAKTGTHTLLAKQ